MSEPPAIPFIPARASPLSGRRLLIRNWLRTIEAESLAEMYEGAVDLLENRTPGYVRFVAHAVREIANGLPSKVYSEHKKGRVEYPVWIDEIRREWGDGLGREPSSPLPSGPAPTLPERVVAKLRGLIDAHVAGTQRVDRSIRGLFTEAERRRSGNDPTPVALEWGTQQWKRMKKWSLNHAHDNGTADNGTDEAEFRRRFELFEALLASLFEDFVNAQQGANEILEKANS